MKSLNDLNLRINPFIDITPNLSGTSSFWAEMHDVKTKLESAYADCINNNSKQLILNWGAYGGGKTFSASYFINEKASINNLQQIYIRCPKDGGKATGELFRSIVDYLSFDKIQEQIKLMIRIYGESEFIEFLSPVTGREYAKAIALIGSIDDEVGDTMNRFLYAGLTKSELKKLGLARDIQLDSDIIKFLGGLFLCYVGDGKKYDGRVVMWVDELEDLIYFSAKNYKAFSQIIRDLFDTIPNGFLAFLNFTLAEGEESTVELILGGAVWSRLSKKIRYKNFSLENAYNYTKELLDFAILNQNVEKALHDDVIMSVIGRIPQNNLTPREINKHFRSLINFGMESGAKRIDSDIANRWMMAYEDDN